MLQPYYAILLGVLRLCAALPSWEKRQGMTCIDDNHYSEPGVTNPRPVPPGTVCRDSGNGIVFEYAGGAANSMVGSIGVPASGANTLGTVATSIPAGGRVSAVASSGSVPTGTPPPPAGAAQIPLGPSPAGIVQCDNPDADITVDDATLSNYTSANPQGKRFVAYWSAWHGTGQGNLPTAEQLEGVTHLILAFWDPNTMNAFSPSGNTLWTTATADQLRAIKSGMKVGAAFGGWALDEFFRFNATAENRDGLAAVFAKFVLDYGLDGVDVDWEYPVSNGATYNTTRPESQCDRNNNVLLMQSVRKALDKNKDQPNGKQDYFLSLAVPGKPGDMMAYTAKSAPLIDKVVDFWNLMTYDFMNRRDATLVHHAGGGVISEVVKAYTAIGVKPEKMNIGFPMYAKWFRITDGTCSASAPLGCNVPADAFEGPGGAGKDDASGVITYNLGLMTAKDMGTTNFGYIQPEVLPSWGKVSGARASNNTTGSSGVTVISDTAAYASTALDTSYRPNIFWTWLSAADTQGACQAHLPSVGGIMVWSIGMDENGDSGGSHFKGLQTCLGV